VAWAEVAGRWGLLPRWMKDVLGGGGGSGGSDSGGGSGGGEVGARLWAAAVAAAAERYPRIIAIGDVHG